MELTLDWDFIDYPEFRTGRLAEMGIGIAQFQHLWVRSSAGGRVHVRGKLHRSVPLVETFPLRALYLDDRQRLVLDMCRYVRGEEVNRLWDEKYVKGMLRRAGEWVQLW